MWSTFSRGVEAFIVLQGSLSICLAEINYVSSWGIETLTTFGRRIETFKHLAGELRPFNRNYICMAGDQMFGRGVKVNCINVSQGGQGI